MGIWYRMGTVPRAQDSAHTPTTLNVQTVVSSPQPAPAPAPALPKYVLVNRPCTLACNYSFTQQMFVFKGTFL